VNTTPTAHGIDTRQGGAKGDVLFS